MRNILSSASPCENEGRRENAHSCDGLPLTKSYPAKR